MWLLLSFTRSYSTTKLLILHIQVGVGELISSYILCIELKYRVSESDLKRLSSVMMADSRTAGLNPVKG